MDKGTRVRIIGGRSGVGVAGAVFWIGENRYGLGERYGVEGDDGQTYWVSAEHTELSTDAPQDDPGGGPEPVRGSRVRWSQDGESGTGKVFWYGDGRRGGKRVGVNRDDNGETIWLQARQVEVVADEPGPPAESSPWDREPVDHVPAGYDGGAPPAPWAPPSDDDVHYPEWEDEEPPF